MPIIQRHFCIFTKTHFLLKNKLALLRILAASLVGLFLLAYLLLLVPAIQHKLATTLANRFSKAIGTEVKLGQVRFSLFDKLDIQEMPDPDDVNEILSGMKPSDNKVSSSKNYS